MLLHLVSAPVALAAALSMLILPGNPAAAADAAPLVTAQDQPPLRFARFDEVEGGPLSNANGDTLGRVEDLLIDRGSGDIRYLVLDRGGILDGVGIGGSSRAIPWSHISAATADVGAGGAGAGAEAPARRPAALIARVSPEQFDRMPEFDAADHAAVQSRSWVEALRSAVSDWTDWSADDHADPFAGSLDAAERTTIEGEIASVRRDRAFEGAEQIIVEVRRSDGRVKVALGPSWFVMGSAHPPRREAEITLEALVLEQGEGIDAVAMSYAIEGAVFELRGEDGTARWTAPEPPSGDDEAQEGDDRSARGHLVLASDIVGASATAHGKDAGKIKRLVIEQTTGVVAFVEIDPDANFLGLAETTRLVPWEALTTVGAERLRLDASPQTLTTAPQSPPRGETAKWFADESNRDRIYKLFQFEPRRFSTRPGGV